MNGTVLDILIYVFDRYMFDESPEVPEREALARDLESAGFGEANVERALDWLADLAGQRSRSELLAAPLPVEATDSTGTLRSLRIYAPSEMVRLSADCRGLLLSLERGLPGLGIAVLGAAVGFGTLWLVGYVGTVIARKEAMGGGDIKMMAMVGAFLGWQGILLTIFLGALIGTLVFVPITLFKRDELVPFGIFLALGGAAAWIAGPEIIAWYRTFAGL